MNNISGAPHSLVHSGLRSRKAKFQMTAPIPGIDGGKSEFMSVVDCGNHVVLQLGLGWKPSMDVSMRHLLIGS